MLPHPLHKRILSRVAFYSGVFVIGVLMQLVTPDPIANEAEGSLADNEAAEAFYAFPTSH